MCAIKAEVVVGEDDVDKVAEIIGGWGGSFPGVEGYPARLEAFRVGDVCVK